MLPFKLILVSTADTSTLHSACISLAECNKGGALGRMIVRSFLIRAKCVFQESPVDRTPKMSYDREVEERGQIALENVSWSSNTTQNTLFPISVELRFLSHRPIIVQCSHPVSYLL